MSTEEKCPICKGVPEAPDVEGCLGCFECDFTGTKAGYDEQQEANRRAMEAADKMDFSDFDSEP